MMDGGMMGGFGGVLGGLGLVGGFLGTLLTVGVFVALVFLGIWLWQGFGTPDWASAWTEQSVIGKTSALDILRARYACGELTREEYQDMLRDLA